MILRYLIEKEFIQMVRDPLLPRLILLFPCMMMLLMPWAANLEIKNNRVCVVDRDVTPESRRLIEKVAASDYFDLTGYADNYDAALREIENGTADVVLEIPEHMEKDKETGRTPTLRISANAVNGTKGGLGSSYLSETVTDFFQSETGVSAVEIRQLNLYNPHLNYKVFMIPALMAMMLTMLCGFLPALNIVSEKEKGTIEQLNVTPVGKLTFIFAKLVPYWCVGLVVLSLCFVLAAAVYGIYPEGNLLAIYLFACIYILIVSGIGLIISSHSGTMQQAMFVMFFFMMILILMSGLFTPIRSMPAWAQWITVFNPLTYFIEVMRLLYLKGSSFFDLQPQLFKLLAFMILINVIAVWTYRKTS